MGREDSWKEKEGRDRAGIRGSGEAREGRMGSSHAFSLLR